MLYLKQFTSPFMSEYEDSKKIQKVLGISMRFILKPS